MIYDRELLDKLDKLRADQWQGEAFRHMFGDYPPERENQRGARWNPAETPAIYTSLTREVALAEGQTSRFPYSLFGPRHRARSIESVSSYPPSLPCQTEPVWSRSESQRKISSRWTIALASAWAEPSRGSATMVSWFRQHARTASTW